MQRCFSASQGLSACSKVILNRKQASEEVRFTPKNSSNSYNNNNRAKVHDHACSCLWHFGERSPTRETGEQNHWTNIACFYFIGQNYCLQALWSSRLLRVLRSAAITLWVDFLPPGRSQPGLPQPVTLALSWWAWWVGFGWWARLANGTIPPTQVSPSSRSP